MTYEIPNLLQGVVRIDEALDAGMPESVRAGPVDRDARLPNVQRCAM